MANRIYENYSELKTDEVRAIFDRIGNTLTLAGIILQGQSESYFLILPGFEYLSNSINPTPEEWTAILKQSDDPIIFEQDKHGLMKPLIRKAQYAISGDIQQRIWVRDNLQCMYCHRKIGEVTLTIDHFIPLELGGTNNPENYLSCCRKDNKRKGNLDPQEWCRKENLDYQFYLDYLRRF